MRSPFQYGFGVNYTGMIMDRIVFFAYYIHSAIQMFGMILAFVGSVLVTI